MTLTKQSAWSIFKGIALGQQEAKKALDTMHHGEFEAYDCWREDFEMAVAQIGVEAQNEAAKLTDKHPAIEALGDKRLIDFTAKDYISMVALFEGAKFEKLHLTALFRVANNELLLELAEAEVLA